MIKRFLSFLIGLFSLVVGFAPTTSVSAWASAADGVYSSALEDLRIDAAFDENSFEKVEGDASFELLTIAESVNNEVFVYVYQPAAAFVGSSINLSVDADNVDTYSNYLLTLLSQDGVFQKYRVEDLQVSTADVRVYEISSMFRPFDEDIDVPATGEDQTINEVSYPVGKRFEFSEDGVSVTDVELITVTDKYVGFMRYETFNILAGVACDAHYIAFSTDKKMENLLEADVYYQSQSVHQYSGSTWGTEYGEIEDKYVYLSFNKTLDWVSNKWYAPDQRSFPTILTSDEFIESEHFSKSYNCGVFNITTVNEMTKTSKETVSAKDWVLRFAITDYLYTERQSSLFIYQDWKYSIVSNVSILRLKYSTDGEVFNLGVVDNKQSGGIIPDNEFTTTVSLNWFFWIIFSVVVLTVLYCVPFLRPFMSVVFKLIGYIIGSPFFLIRWIVGKIRGDDV